MVPIRVMTDPHERDLIILRRDGGEIFTMTRAEAHRLVGDLTLTLLAATAAERLPDINQP